MGRKKVDRWRQRAELVNQGATVLLLFFGVFLLHWWMTARCTMLSSGGLPSNREMAHVCAGYASSFAAWKRTYHDLPTAVYKVVRGWNARTNISKLWDPHPQCHWEEMVSMLVWIARALKPIARGLAHWRSSRCIDGFLGHQMTNESESVKCSPSPISQPIHLTLQTPSRSNGLIGEEKLLLQAPIVPNCKTMKSQIIPN